MPLLKGNNSLEREGIFWHYPHYGNQGGTPGSSVRLGNFKLIEFFEDNRVELYNLREDAGEQQDLSEIETDKTEELKEILWSWQNRVNAKLPQPNPDYSP